MPAADGAVVVAVVGSRGYPRLDLVRAYIGSLQPGDTVITGDAPGVDHTAFKVARARRDLTVVQVEAHWKDDQGHKDAFAGYLRNPEIITPADEGVAFWDAESHGTADSIQITLEQQKPLTVLGPDGRIIDPDRLISLLRIPHIARTLRWVRQERERREGA